MNTSPSTALYRAGLIEQDLPRPSHQGHRDMSYPPNPYGEQDDPMLGASNGAQSRGPSPSEQKDREDEELNAVRRYEDFTTVDWIQDSLHERNIRSKGPGRRGSIFARLDNMDGILGYVWRLVSQVLEEGESWVVLSLVGIGIGLSAALISIMTVWLSDLKMGYCTTGWWLSQKFCCLEVSDEGEGCAEWRNWGGMEPFQYIFYVLFAALFSFSAAFLVRAFAPYAAGSGISEIKCILGGFIIKGFLDVETFFLKGLTLPLAIGSGLSVGKEGPSVHLACSFGNVVARMFRRYDQSHAKMREIVTASSAAGVAVAFGSPIGGVLFAIEEMNQTFSTRTMWRSFVCALVATFTLASMDPFRTGKLVLFQVSYDRDWHYFELPAFILIGIFGGLYGALVIKFNLQVAAFRRKNLAAHGVAEAVTLATITAIIGYLNRFLRIDMTEMMSLLFRECEGGGDHNGLCQSSEQWKMVNSLLLATIIRIGFIIISYGCKVPCGIFVPSMAVGACFGRMIGIVVKALHASAPDAPWFAACQPDAPCITPGTYAYLGAAAALSGVTRLTVTVVVIMFELTGALTYLLPVMITLLVTKAVSDQIGGGGMADEVIRFNGFPFLEKEDKEADDDAFVEPIAHVMKQDLVMMKASGMPLQQISEIVQSTSYQGFPVVRSDEDRTIIGFVNKVELRYALDKAMRTRHLSPDATCTFLALGSDLGNLNGSAQPDIVIPGRNPGRSPNIDQSRPSASEANEVDFGQYVDEIPLSVSPKMPLEIVMQLFRRMGPRVILVSQEGRLVGLVTVKDVLRHEAITHHRSSQAKPTPLGHTSGHSRDSSASWNGWNEEWQEIDVDVRGNGLEYALEMVLAWARDRADAVRGIMGSRATRGGRRRDPQENPAYEYELSEDRPA